MKRFSDYFDKVYIINLVDRKDKRDFMLKQLSQMGVLSDLFQTNKLEIVEAIKYPFFTDEIIEQINSNLGKNVGLLHCAMEHYRILTQAYSKGYKKILILEDDACFHKNLDFVLNALETAPQNYNILHLEGYYFPDIYGASIDDWKNMLADNPEDGKWQECGWFNLWATAAIVWTRDAMKTYIEKQNEEFCAPDYNTLRMENSFFYTYPLVRQEDKNIMISDSFSYAKNADSTNIYLSKSDNSQYYHIYNI